jgi:glycosyltransferase involved in cell wall biosynthesis
MYIIAHNGARIFGGGEIRPTLLLAGLHKRGHRVLMFCNTPEIAARVSQLGVPSEVLPLSGDFAVHQAVRLARRLRKEQPDVLLLTTFKKTWLGGLAGKLARVPHIVSKVVLSTDLLRNMKYVFTYRYLIDTVVLNADEMRARFANGSHAISPERIVTIYDGVDVGRGSSTLREVLGIPEDGKVIGAVTRLAKQKRLDVLLRSFSIMDDTSAHCILAGEGPDRESLESLAIELGIRERVHFLGHRTDIGNVLGALDLFVVTSDSEGMNNAMLEAMAAGIPVVTTPVSGAAEALRGRRRGVAPGVIVQQHPVAIARALSRLLEDPDQRRRMAEAGVTRASEAFSMDNMVGAWEDLLMHTAAPAVRATQSMTQ